MERFVIEDLSDVAIAMYNEIVDNKKTDVMFVGFYEDAIAIIKELVMFEEVCPRSIEIHPVDWDWYDKEYYVTLDENFEVWCEPAYHIKEDGSVYYESETDILFITDDCNSSILNKISNKGIIEVAFASDENECCEDCCGECYCHNDCNEELDNHSVLTHVITDEKGKIRGFSKKWETNENGIHIHSYYEHYCDNEKLVKELMENFHVKL